MLDMMYIPSTEYAICSENTQVLANIYIENIYQGSGDFRIDAYYPLLDRLNEWLDETYGR